MNFVFFGTSEFAIPILDALEKQGWPPKLIITTPDKPSGRGLKPKSSPVKIWAKKNDIPVFQPENLKSPEFIKHLQDILCPVSVVASYGKIIPKEILDVFPKGILNVHPSLLPRWRGADPIRSAILAGDKKTGVSIMLIDEKMDHGPTLAARELEFLISNFKFLKLYGFLTELGGKLLVETLPKWLTGEIEPKEQDHSKATYTKKITKEDGHINWAEPAEIIERKIRALNPWPGTYSFWNGKRIKILESQLRSDFNQKWTKSGFVHRQNSGLGITCKDGAILVKKLQMEGKKIQSATEFLNGYPDIIGVILT